MNTDSINSFKKYNELVNVIDCHLHIVIENIPINNVIDDLDKIKYKKIRGELLRLIALMIF